MDVEIAEVGVAQVAVPLAALAAAASRLCACWRRCDRTGQEDRSEDDHGDERAHPCVYKGGAQGERARLDATTCLAMLRDHGTHQRPLPKARRRLPVSRDRPPRGAPSRRPTRRRIIRLGIGDVVLPLARRDLRRPCTRPSTRWAPSTGFRGYGPEQGYDFLREAIAEHDFRSRGADVDADEIFVSDGSKCDSGNIQEIFAVDARVAMPDPVYPVYVDTNVMAGRTGDADARGRYAGFLYLAGHGGRTASCPSRRASRSTSPISASPTTRPAPSPTRAQLERWVAWAKKNGAILLYDAAYEAFITDPSIPHSIYEIAGAREVAIEFRSFSKTAGFTGMRCAYIVVPKELQGEMPAASASRCCNRLEPPPHHQVQRRLLSGPARRRGRLLRRGPREVRERIDYYMANAGLIREGLTKLGLNVFGGVNAPYVWVKTPERARLVGVLRPAARPRNVVGTPGAGFGACGEGYFRLSAFGMRENVEEAIARIRSAL